MSVPLDATWLFLFCLFSSPELFFDNPRLKTIYVALLFFSRLINEQLAFDIPNLNRIILLFLASYSKPKMKGRPSLKSVILSERINFRCKSISNYVKNTANCIERHENLTIPTPSLIYTKGLLCLSSSKPLKMNY